MRLRIHRVRITPTAPRKNRPLLSEPYGRMIEELKRWNDFLGVTLVGTIWGSSPKSVTPKK